LKLAGNDALRRRVEKASICAYRAAIEPVWSVKDPSKVDPAVAKQMRPLVVRFLTLCERYNVTQDYEGHPFKVARDRVRKAVGL